MLLLLLGHQAVFVATPQAFVAAAGALGPAEDPQQLKAAADALDALLPLGSRLDAVASLRAALATLHAAGTSDAYVPEAVADLQTVEGVALSVGAIADTLRALEVRAGWRHLCPC